MNVECFSCAGGMAEGFRRAGIEFKFAFDYMRDHCESYHANLGHRPICMDVRDLLRMAEAGLVSPSDIDLFVADPPCTPWSRAGLRKGTSDERDMIEDTCELIRLLRPRAYLIGNVPGLDDSKNWPVVQRVIGGLAKYGYCVADFAALNAVNYGTPQQRTRPFWFGHLDGPCIQWPAPTHADPKTLTTYTLPGFEALRPWITVRQAIGHLSKKDRGRPVRLRKRSQNSKQHGSVQDKPARVVGTSNLSDGNVLLFNDRHPPADLDAPSPAITAKERGPGGQLVSSRDRTEFEGGYTPSTWDEPAHAVLRNTHGDGSVLVLREEIVVSKKHPALKPDAPSTTVRGGGNGHSAPALVYDEHHPPMNIDQPANVVRAGDGKGATRAVRLRSDDDEGAIVEYTSKHPPHEIDQPALTLSASDGGGSKNAMRTRDLGRTGQGMRRGKPDKPSATVTSKASRVGAGAGQVVEWFDRGEWSERPSTVVQSDPRLAPPGHHDENYRTRSLETAIVLSEKAAALLQGFPESWVFKGSSKKARWSQIGQAMPPQLSEAVGRSVAEQRRRTREPEAEIPSSLATGKLTVV